MITDATSQITGSISITLLTSFNTALLDSVAEDVFDFPVREEYLTAFVQDQRHVMYLAVQNQEKNPLVVGMISGVEYFHPDKPAQLWINELGVGSRFRNAGIGKRLTNAMIQHARAAGHPFIWVGTDTDNTPAQRVFSSISDVEDPQPFLLYQWDYE